MTRGWGFELSKANPPGFALSPTGVGKSRASFKYTVHPPNGEGRRDFTVGIECFSNNHNCALDIFIYT